METANLIHLAIPFVVAIGMTHLIVLPIKTFLIEGELRDLAMRANTWNLMALIYTAGVLFLFGVESHNLFQGVAKFLPAFIALIFSIGIWGYILVRATKKFVLVDVAVFTILAFAAS